MSIGVGGCILIVYVSISDRDDGEGIEGGVHVVGFTSASWIYSLDSHTLSLTEVTPLSNVRLWAVYGVNSSSLWCIGSPFGSPFTLVGQDEASRT